MCPWSQSPDRDAARSIDVVDYSDQSGAVYGALLMNGGTLSESTVDLASPLSVGVKAIVSQVVAQPNVLRASSVSCASTGVVLQGGGAVERSRVASDQVGLWAQGGASSVESSVVRLTKGGGFVAYAAGATTGTTLRLVGDTLRRTLEP